MIRVKDSLGNIIFLTSDCWNNHILVRHPIMKHFFHQLKNAICEPDYIYKSKNADETRLYYRLEHTKYGKIYFLVIIDMKPDKKTGYVKTALPVYKIKRGELLWQKV